MEPYSTYLWCVWLSSLSGTFVRFIHVTCCSLFIFITIKFVSISNLFNHSSVDGCWCCFKFRTATNVLAHVFWWTYCLFLLSTYLVVIELACLGSMGTAELFSQNGWTNSQSHQWCASITIAPDFVNMWFWLHFNLNHLSG